MTKAQLKHTRYLWNTLFEAMAVAGRLKSVPQYPELNNVYWELKDTLGTVDNVLRMAAGKNARRPT